MCIYIYIYQLLRRAGARPRYCPGSSSPALLCFPSRAGPRPRVKIIVIIIIIIISIIIIINFIVIIIIIIIIIIMCVYIYIYIYPFSPGLLHARSGQSEAARFKDDSKGPPSIRVASVPRRTNGWKNITVICFISTNINHNKKTTHTYYIYIYTQL